MTYNHQNRVLPLPYDWLFEADLVHSVKGRVQTLGDFDFTSDRYRDHMSRIGYRRELLKYVLQGDGPLLNKSVRASSQLFY